MTTSTRTPKAAELPASRASQRDLGTRRVVVDKREAILDAALALFVERGFFGTAVPEIGRASCRERVFVGV